MISVIICSISPGKFAAISQNLEKLLAQTPFEIIGIHDARSLCEGYNRGMARSRGDILVFCHDDIEIITPDFARRLRRHMRQYDVIGCAGTTRALDSTWLAAGDPFVHGQVAYPVDATWPGDRFNLSVWGGIKTSTIENAQLLDGFFLAATRRVMETVQFDEQRFDGFHGYDADFTHAAHLAGFRLAVCKDILIAHQSVGNYGEAYQVYAQRFREKYLGRLPGLPRNKVQVALARNVSRTQMLALCEFPG